MINEGGIWRTTKRKESWLHKQSRNENVWSEVVNLLKAKNYVSLFKSQIVPKESVTDYTIWLPELLYGT